MEFLGWLILLLFIGVVVIVGTKRKYYRCKYPGCDNWYSTVNEFQPALEDNFKKFYESSIGFGEKYCLNVDHICDDLILNKCTTFLIFKFVTEKNTPNTTITPRHRKKMKKLAAK